MVVDMKKTQFPNVTDEEWQEIALQSLRGLPFERLITKTVEEIDIQPLYTYENTAQSLGEFQEDFVNMIRDGKKSADWIIAQQSYVSTSGEFLAELKNSLVRGNEAIVYDGIRPVTWESDDLKELAELMTKYPVYCYNIAKEDSINEAFNLIPMEQRKRVQGVFTGEMLLPDGYYLVRTQGADTIEFHLAGADMVTELAITLAKAAESAVNFASFTQFENQFFVRFAIDTNFFMEMAKLRAFRVLWQTFAKAYGHEKSSYVPIISETSLRTYSKLDAYVNLLRAGNEAFSAALGGTDVLTVHPHNLVGELTPAANRHARNIQLVIKEETSIENVIDPAGGSYYIDTLTNQLVENAWDLFLQIENQGGYDTFIAEGKLAKRIEKVRDVRVHELSTIKKSLIGTNVYADINEDVNLEASTINVVGRLPEIYENLRHKFSKAQPNVILLNFGELKDFKARADFVSSYFATAGIKVSQSPAFKTVDQALAWIANNEFDYGIICTHPKETELIMEAFIKDFPSNQWIDVAGKYDEQLTKKWLDAGVAGFVYQGQDQLDKFRQVENRWKGESHHG